MASANFDSADKGSWYFGKLSRQDTQDKLLKQKHGTFLVRDSKTCPGDFVLSVSENSKVSHYIINSVQGRLKIGDQHFDNVTELLEFYKIHYLDTTTLIEPISKAPKPVSNTSNSHLSYPSQGKVSSDQVNLVKTQQGKDEKSNSQSAMPLVRAVFDFKSDDVDDLPFSKGEILQVLEKPEENWWNARNAQGRIGQIPVPYVEVHVANKNPLPGAYQSPGVAQHLQQSRPLSMPSASELPALAEVITKRVPNAYDPTALRLNVGEHVKVTKMNKNGQWEGECNGNSGWFPFTHVKIIENK